MHSIVETDSCKNDSFSYVTHVSCRFASGQVSLYGLGNQHERECQSPLRKPLRMRAIHVCILLARSLSDAVVLFYGYSSNSAVVGDNEL